MAQLTLLQAINDALKNEMKKDDRVVIFGEDVGYVGGVFRATEGLQKEFGESRCFDTPLCESGIIGAAIGMSLYGLKPVAEIQFLDFIYPAFDQIISEAAKMRYRSGGQFTCPLVIRAPYGGGIKGGHFPSKPYDAKGLFISAIRDPDPVMFLEPKRLYRSLKGEVPEGDYTVPIGKAHIVQEGADVTLFCYGAMVPVSTEAAQKASSQGISCEVVDLRTITPLDMGAILAAAQKTGRVVIVHEAVKTAGFGAEISALISERAMEYMKAPILRVAGFDTPFPYTLEHVYMPDSIRVLRAVEKVMQY
ncbi:MAG: alpha-ketoacid dehydrogenase subunit beta [Deltaproteobacteria bacterium]|nr:alpha-ketoacid dehydrogenase subunit beta [Deltaproteobacteria bacterium]